MTYEYQTEDGEVVTRTLTLSEALKAPIPDAITLEDGRVAKRVWGVATPSPKGWPMKPCIASGVQPEQAQELRDLFKRHGVPTEVTKDGDPIYTSPKHREKCLKVRGLYDRSSYR